MSLPTIANIQTCEGLKILLEASIPEAFHDSFARHPPPECHPGTRQNFIDEITGWGVGTMHQGKHLLWVQGPAGVGKSAVAQSCAEFLAPQNKLGATFFFSRLNEWCDSNLLFTSISYQIARKSDSYSNILDRDIGKDPTLVKKSIKRQFQEFFVKPLRELRSQGEDVGEKVIIIDGLDECAGIGAQCDIIEIIATSVREETTPFRWALFSRPEPHIVASFTSDRIFPLSLHIELAVSRQVDHEIWRYLSDELRRIQEQHGLPPSWPSEQDIATLVCLSAGLFVYPATVIRFIGEHNSLGPVDQLHAVLALATRGGKANSDHPLAELDLFYTLIMRQIPSKILPTIQKVLLLKSFPPIYSFLEVSELVGAIEFANILALTEPQFRKACSTLHSVLQLSLNASGRSDIGFYHASFMEFMQDPQRSKEFCVYSSCLDALRGELLERLNIVHSRSTGTSATNRGTGYTNSLREYSSEKSIVINLTWPEERLSEFRAYRLLLSTFFRLCQSIRPLDSSTVTSLLSFQFQQIPRLNMWSSSPIFHTFELSLERLIENVIVSSISFACSANIVSQIPPAFRNKIVRRTYNPGLYLCKPAAASLERPYILGCGKYRVICWKRQLGWTFIPYPPIADLL